MCTVGPIGVFSLQLQYVSWFGECRGFESHPGQLIFPLSIALVGVATHLPCTP